MRHLAFALAVLSSVPSIGFAQSPASPVVVAARALDPSTVPQSQPAPDAPEPPPLEIEPAPSEFEPPPSLLSPPRLVPVAPISTGDQRRHHWPLWRILTGSALVVGGGVMLGFGMSAFAYDGVCVPTPPPGVLACRRYYETKDKGIALVTSGVLTAVGGLLLATIPSRRPRTKLTAQLLLPNLGIAIGGNF